MQATIYQIYVIRGATSLDLEGGLEGKHGVDGRDHGRRINRTDKKPCAFLGRAHLNSGERDSPTVFRLKIVVGSDLFENRATLLVH